jgi:ComF family protein
MWQSLLSLFLQSNCLLCQRSADLLCPYCRNQLQDCQLGDKAQFWGGDLPRFVWGKYDGVLKRAIAILKYDGQRQLGELLGFWLGQAWLNSPVSSPLQQNILVPIPLHPDKLKTRGFNQAELIARGFAKVTGYSLQVDGLVRVKNTPPMFGLKPQQREENIQSAFALGRQFQNRLPRNPILLIDDIYTTGATAREAATVLRQQGIKVLGIAAVASSAGLN